jgi:hypothetical protein
MIRKSQAAEHALEEERAKLKAIIEQEYQDRAAELRRSLAIVRSELGGILAEEARRLAEERRQEFEEKERRAATEYSIRLHQVQQRVEERLAEWAQDLERLETGLAGAIARVEERQREQLQDVHRQVKQDIEEIAVETREHKATVLRPRPISRTSRRSAGRRSRRCPTGWARASGSCSSASTGRRAKQPRGWKRSSRTSSGARSSGCSGHSSTRHRGCSRTRRASSRRRSGPPRRTQPAGSPASSSARSPVSRPKASACFAGRTRIAGQIVS